MNSDWWLSRPMNSYVASCCTCFRTASYASATSASWPTGAVPLSCLFAFPCSARHRKQSKTRQAPRTPLIFGSAPSVLDRWWRLTAAEMQLRSPPLVTAAAWNNSVHKILRASPRSVVVRLIAEQICSSGFLGGSLCHIFSENHAPNDLLCSASQSRRIPTPTAPYIQFA